MAPGPRHYREAERLLRQGLDLEHYVKGLGHAVLALAAATAHGLPAADWPDALESKASEDEPS